MHYVAVCQYSTNVYFFEKRVSRVAHRSILSRKTVKFKLASRHIYGCITYPSKDAIYDSAWTVVLRGRIPTHLNGTDWTAVLHVTDWTAVFGWKTNTYTLQNIALQKKYKHFNSTRHSVGTVLNLAVSLTQQVCHGRHRRLLYQDVYKTRLLK